MIPENTILAEKEENFLESLDKKEERCLETIILPLEEKKIRNLKCKEWVNIGILLCLTLLSFMDMYTIASVLESVQIYFKINNEKGGLLRTVFACSFLAFSPIFGMLGDRYNRKIMMTFGVCLWSSSVFVSTFITNYWWFLFMRALLGVGKATVTTIAPTIIGDMFADNIRSKVLAMYYFSGLLGSGLGYIIASAAANITDNQWQWALRVTFPLAVITVFLVAFVLDEPVRVRSKESDHLEPNSWKMDVKYILRNKTYMFTTAAFICAVFVVGSVDWWGPKLIALGVKVQDKDGNVDDIGYKFGAIIMVAALTGVPIGVVAAETFRKKFANGDSHFCILSLFISVPISCSIFIMAKYNFHVCFACLFLIVLGYSMIWAVATNMILTVVDSRRRAIAMGLHTFAVHAFGDAGSPYIIGIVSDIIKAVLNPKHSDKMKEFLSLQYAMFLNSLVLLIGAICSLFVAYSFEHDKKEADRRDSWFNKQAT